MNVAQRGETLVMPEEPGAKLPLVPLPGTGGSSAVPPALQAAWINYMINGFRQNEKMFESTLQGFMKPYRLTIWFYSLLFAVGLGLFVAAAIIGLSNGNSVVAIAFGGLSVTAFLSFFIQRPMQALEENLEFITWLGVAFNTYWTRLMYLSDPKTIDADLKSVDDDFRASVKELIAEHSALRTKRGANG